MTESEYKALLRPHKRALRQIQLDLDFFIEDIGTICLYSITSRLKSFTSALQKSERLRIKIEEIQDLAGLGIVVATRQEVDIVAKFFSRQEQSKDLSIKSDKKIDREDGYRARHIVFTTKSSYKRSVFPGQVEAQLQTIFEHAFNFISRTWVYKSNYTFTPEWKRNFKKMSGKLERLETDTTKLHEAVIESATKDGSDEPLSPLSYQRIVKSVFGEIISLEHAVDGCRFAVDRGIETNGMFKAFLEAPQISQLRERFLSQTSSEGAFFSKQVSAMSKYSFWSMFGYRYKAFEDMLNKIEKNASENDTNSNSE